MLNTYFTANLPPTDVLAEVVTVSSRREEEPFRFNGVVYLIFGLAAISVLLIIVYLFTHLAEKCNVQNKTS